MRVLHLDIDTLRADHLGCYGYCRPTSPNIDRLAADSVRFDQLYVSDSPCLPSRTALFSGQFGVHSGVVNHGGRRADPFPAERGRRRMSRLARTSWPSLLRRAGLWCATVSTFGERHSAFHWYSGFNEVYNLGTGGLERANKVAAAATDWLRRRGREDDWYLHVHFWDPHTPYRTPPSYGDPLGDDGRPVWIDETVRARHWSLPGPHTAQDVLGYGPDERFEHFTRQPQQISSAAEVGRMFDGYDTGIRYADDYIGRILDLLDELGIGDDTAVLLSSDHGENLGELGIYCDHQTADVCTHRVPLLLRWPGVAAGVVPGFHYQLDLVATIAELLDQPVPDIWDGISVAPALKAGVEPQGRDHLVLSCAAWSVQRAVRFDRWLYVRTYHDAYHGFPDAQLFDLEADPYEQHDVASAHADISGRAAALLVDWETAAMRRSRNGIDPLWTVIHEGGGFYARDRLQEYQARLIETGRGGWAEMLAAKHRRR
ncbi:MAG: sulfatase [Acidimicrobiaceae bacterium]|nr:sulfatase [Acidimicrobiaceae bacterium]